MPKIRTDHWRQHIGAPHPKTGQNDGPYDDIALGDMIGLTQFGVRLERLPAGSRSSHRHWHENEDEFIYLISGELVLIEKEESRISAGEAAGWKAGQPTAHCLENRSGSDAVLLVVGTRLARDVIHYPDHDMILHRDGDSRDFTRGDGSPMGNAD